MSFLSGIGGKILTGLAAAADLAWAIVTVIGRLMAAGADRVYRRNAEAGIRNVKIRQDVETDIADTPARERRNRLSRWVRD